MSVQDKPSEATENMPEAGKVELCSRRRDVAMLAADDAVRFWLAITAPVLAL